jgi:hypothetical protein
MTLRCCLDFLPVVVRCIAPQPRRFDVVQRKRPPLSRLSTRCVRHAVCTNHGGGTLDDRGDATLMGRFLSRRDLRLIRRRPGRTAWATRIAHALGPRRLTAGAHPAAQSRVRSRGMHVNAPVWGRLGASGCCFRAIQAHTSCRRPSMSRSGHPLVAHHRQRAERGQPCGPRSLYQGTAGSTLASAGEPDNWP